MDGELIDQDIDSPVTLCQWSQGFYGHTEGWAVVRAGEGLLLSTSARPAQGASVARTQMDGSEAVGQLKAAQQLGDALGQSARQQGAHGLHSHEPGQAWAQHTEAMDPSARGRYAGAVGGQDARQARAGSRDLGDPVERFAQPLIHLDTPTSAAWVTPASIHLFSGQDQSISAQGDVHLTAAHTVSSVSGQTTSLYTHAGGIKAITANAGLSVRAHTDSQQVWSEQDLTVQSSTDEVRIQASKSITLTAGQSQIVIEGGNITFTCPGTWTVKGASHDWLGGGSQPAALANMPSGTVSQSPDEVMTAGQYLGKYEMFKADNRPFVGYDYEIRNSSGRVLASGKTDAAGYAQLLVTPQEEGIRAYKSVKPDSERITENWQGKLGSAAARAQNA